MPSDIDICRSANLFVTRHGEDAPIEAAMRADAMLDREDVEGVYGGSLFRDSHPSYRIGTRKHEQPEGGKIMARKAKPKKKTKAPRKAAVASIEAGLTKGELRKGPLCGDLRPGDLAPLKARSRCTAS